MKCSTMLHFIRVYKVCKGKSNLQTKNTIFVKNYNPTLLYMYKLIVSNQNKESISIQKVKVSQVEIRNYGAFLS